MSRDVPPDWTALARARRQAARRSAAERKAADAALVQLLALAPGERRRRIRDDARFRTVALVTLLLEQSLPAAAEDPDLGHELARLALDVIDRLDRRRHPRPFLATLEAWAWGLVAYASWVAQRWDAVREALERAGVLLAGAARDLSGPGMQHRERALAESFVPLTRAVLALVRTLEADPDRTED